MSLEKDRITILSKDHEPQLIEEGEYDSTAFWLACSCGWNKDNNDNIAWINETSGEWREIRWWEHILAPKHTR